MTPKLLLRTVSIVEACTWTILLVGMLVKYAFGGTGLIVSIGGSLHGAAFLAYLFCGLIVGVNQRFTWPQLIVGGLASIPPFATLLFDWWAERARLLEGGWRRLPVAPGAAPEPDGDPTGGSVLDASGTSTGSNPDESGTIARSIPDAPGTTAHSIPDAPGSIAHSIPHAPGTATATIAPARTAHPADARVAEQGSRPAKLSWLDGLVRWSVGHPATLVCTLIMVFTLILTGALSA